MKKIGIACLPICIACILMALALYLTWSSFTPKAIMGSEVQREETDLEKISEAWFEDFFKQYEGVFVPFEYRIVKKEIESISVLDRENRFVQIDYKVKPASLNTYAQAYYSAIEEDGFYKVQVVLQFKKQDAGYIISEKMRPVEYQIQTDPNLNTPQTQHYAMQDTKETYFFEKEALYVTYDHGVHNVKVPVTYKQIAGSNSTIFNESLPTYGYMVSKEFTAFVAYDDEGSYLLYSENEGNTWNTSRIYKNRYRGESTYLSKTSDACYVTIAVDRSLGNEYYTTFKTSDFQTWESLQGEGFVDKEAVVFFDHHIGYSAGGYTQDMQAKINYTKDDGASYQEIILPKQEVEFLNMTITPFVEMEYVYKENDRIYMIVGQGTNGDYMKNKHFIKALYVSEDGVNFHFEKEIEDSSLTLAG